MLDNPSVTQAGLVNRRRCLLSTGRWALSLLVGSGAWPVWAGSYDDFQQALRIDNPSAILGLLLKGFDANTPDPKGNPPLVVALQFDSLNCVELLLSLPEVKVDTLNPQGENALMIAAIRGHVAAVRGLLARKAQANKPGWAPLHYAASQKDTTGTQATALLLEHHAYIDAESPNQTTPLMMAARYGHEDTVRLLLTEGADAQLRNANGMTAMDFARSADRPYIVDILAAHIRTQSSPGSW